MLITMIFGTIWLVGLNLINVIEIAHERWNKHCRNLNLNIFKSICLVYLPSMKKIILSMFKTSFNLSWRIMIAMEILFGAVGKHLGIGTYMNDARELLDVDKMYAIFFIIIISGVFINWLIDILTKNQKRKEISI
jgi:NitT/TauT family transport system permease protein